MFAVAYRIPLAWPGHDAEHICSQHGSAAPSHSPVHCAAPYTRLYTVAMLVPSMSLPRDSLYVPALLLPLSLPCYSLYVLLSCYSLLLPAVDYHRLLSCYCLYVLLSCYHELTYLGRYC